MTRPNDKQCQNIVVELLEHHEKTGELSDWEFEFCDSNKTRSYFTDKQVGVLMKFSDKYVLDCMRGFQ